MEPLLKAIAVHTAEMLELIAVLIVGVGALVALARGLRAPDALPGRFGRLKLVFLTLGVWLVLGLQFELAADVVLTVVAPTWQDLGKLAAIAVIRTFLNFFLEHDLARFVGREGASSHGGG